MPAGFLRIRFSYAVGGQRCLICMTPHWEHFPHGADIGIRGVGCTPAEAFEQAAVALCAVITDVQTVIDRDPIDIHVEAPDRELLFADWINALVYEMAVRNMLFSRFSVRMENEKMDATAWGEATDKLRHQPAVEIKGATYTELRVAQNADGMWLAQCVVDV